jgi:hypothetical protein
MGSRGQVTRPGSTGKIEVDGRSYDYYDLAGILIRTIHHSGIKA